MLLKVFDYTMTMGVVSCVEVLSCSNCVAVMLLKAFDYTMMVDVVLRDEMFFM